MRRRRNNLKIGDNNVIDDITGQKYKASEMRVLSGSQNGLLTHKKNWNPAHPQLKIRSRVDDQNVRHVRLRGADIFEEEQAAPAPEPSWCDGFTGVLCLDGSDDTEWINVDGGSIVSDGSEFTATITRWYAAYLNVETEIGATYDVTLELTSNVVKNFYAEAYIDDGDPPDFLFYTNVLEFLEPMNNEVGLGPGIVTGSFTATTIRTNLLFGEHEGSSYTFKNFTVEKR
jgi:hypothetical protein